MAKPPPPAAIDFGELRREFYFWVGVAITEWAHVDAELFQICSAVLRSPTHLAAIVYYRSQTLSGRLDLTDELVCTLVPISERKDEGQLWRAWQRARKAIRDEIPIRNQLAHSPTAPHLTPAPGWPTETTISSVPPDIWFASYVAQAERMRGRSEDKEPLKVDDVKEHVQKVGAIINLLRDFRSGELQALLSRQPP